MPIPLEPRCPAWIGQQLHQFRAVVLESVQPPACGHLEPAMLPPPQVEHREADPEETANVQPHHPGLLLLRDRNALLVATPAPLRTRKTPSVDPASTQSHFRQTR